MNESWKLDPATKDYEQEGGSPVIDRSLRMPAYFRIMTPRTRWLYAPNTRYGSDFWAHRAKQSSTEPSQVEGIADRALRPIIEDGRASDIEVEAISSGRQYNQLKATLTDDSGEETDLMLNPIGV